MDWDIETHVNTQRGGREREEPTMSIHIVALGSECPGGVGPGEEGPMGQGQLQGGLLWSYLGHGAVVGPHDLENSLHHPAFMEYTSRVFGDVSVVVRDCPSWDLLDSDWSSVRSVLEQADILVIKYSVNDKLAFQQVRNGYAPRLRPLLRHWGVPVILVAVGARLHGSGKNHDVNTSRSPREGFNIISIKRFPRDGADGDRRMIADRFLPTDLDHPGAPVKQRMLCNGALICCPTARVFQLSRDLGATYLELPSLQRTSLWERYFGSVLEFFMIQCLKQKAKERPDKRRVSKVAEPRPPHLEQPARLPPIRVEESSFSQDMQWLLERGVQFADVAFFSGDSGKELGWAHAAVLCAVSPFFRQLLLGPKSRERPQSRCVCRERDAAPHSLLSTWDGGIIDDAMPRPDGHTVGRLSRLVVKDPLLCLCLWETLMFLYRGVIQSLTVAVMPHCTAVLYHYSTGKSKISVDTRSSSTAAAREHPALWSCVSELFDIRGRFL
ncbi:hypothetical protein CRUP_012254, partial [Coryphaenoides rupestris]